MENLSDSLQKAVEYIQNNNFKDAANEITGIKDENDDAYDELHKSLTRLFSGSGIESEKIPSIVKGIQVVYEQHKGNVSQLKEGMANFLTQYGASETPEEEAEEGAVSEPTLKNLSIWSEEQLRKRIEDLRKEQQELLKGGKVLDTKISAELNLLLEERNKRAGYEGREDIAEGVSQDKSQEGVPEGAESWFVLPTEEDLASQINTHVVCGSAMITVLRNRYKKQYKLKTVLDVEKADPATLSADEAYELKRETSRQKEFVNNYLEPSSLMDQDICASEIAAEIKTDKYQKVKHIRINDELSYYVFKGGYLKDLRDSRTMQHVFSMEGIVVGRFSICLNRKEPESGRPISDAYDILDFQDGRPCLYFYSSKGVSSLSDSMENEVKIVLRSVSFDLSIPDSSEARKKELIKEELEEFLKAHKGKGADSSSKEKEMQGKIEATSGQEAQEPTAKETKSDIVPEDTQKEMKAETPTEEKDEGEETKEVEDENPQSIGAARVDDCELIDETIDITDKVGNRISRLEDIAVNSIKVLNDMEGKLSEFNNICDALSENYAEDRVGESITKEDRERSILRKRAEAIKEAIRKKKQLFK